MGNAVWACAALWVWLAAGGREAVSVSGCSDREAGRAGVLLVVCVDDVVEGREGRAVAVGDRVGWSGPDELHEHSATTAAITVMIAAGAARHLVG